MAHVTKEEPPQCKYCQTTATLGKLSGKGEVSAAGTYIRIWRCGNLKCIYYRRAVIHEENK